MRRALQLAARGIGRVEPNPPVGAVVVDDRLRLLGEGWHQEFGGPHAEVLALRAAGGRARGGWLFVTLEPCCHHGKTPPCTEAVIAAGVRKVIVALSDPSPHAAGQGIAQLQAAGIEVETGLLAEEARRLVAPFLKRVTTGRPYVHAKWAMTIDGKIASRTGHSRWISNERSRRTVHELRSRMDAVIVGCRTALVDDPLLTPRLEDVPGSGKWRSHPSDFGAGVPLDPGRAVHSSHPLPRRPVRIVVDSLARLPSHSRLVSTCRELPVLVAATDAASPADVARLREAGVEVLALPPQPEWPEAEPAALRRDSARDIPRARVSLTALLEELGRRQITNVLVEGGGTLLGALFDHGLIDAIHVFIAAKLVGGTEAPAPLAGIGLERIPQFSQLVQPSIELLEGDIYIHGPLAPR